MDENVLETLSLEGEELILVGFGKTSLETVLGWIGTDKEEDAFFAPTKWPPVFRPSRLCDENDLSRFSAYVNWSASIIESIQVAESKRNVVDEDEHSE